jgi:chromosome segregation ATPase
MQSRLGKQDELAAENHQLNAKLRTLQDEIIRFTTEIRQLEISKGFEQELRQRCEKTTKDLVAENTRLSSTSSKIEADFLKRQHDVEENLASKTNLIEKLHQTIGKLEEELIMVKSTMEEKETQQFQLIEEFHAKELEVSKLQDSLSHENDRLDQDSLLLNDLRGEITKLKVEAQQLNQKLEFIEKDFAKQTKILEEKSLELTESKKKLFDIKKKAEIFGRMDAVMKILPMDDLQSIREAMKQL